LVAAVTAAVVVAKVITEVIQVFLVMAVVQRFRIFGQ
jgi:hypothetical protein